MPRDMRFRVLIPLDYTLDGALRLREEATGLSRGAVVRILLDEALGTVPLVEAVTREIWEAAYKQARVDIAQMIQNMLFPEGQE